MRKQQLEELLATYRELNEAESQELEQSVAKFPEYATRLEQFRRLDHALQQVGAQNIANIRLQQARLNHIHLRVMQQKTQSRAGWLAKLEVILSMVWSELARQWQGIAMTSALLLVALLVHGVIGRNEWLATLATINGEGSGSITTAPSDTAIPPDQQQATPIATLSASAPIVSATITNSLSASGLATPGFTYGIEAQLLNGAAAAAFTATEQLGFTWIRQTIAWEDFQPAVDITTRTPLALDAIDWSELQAIVQTAEARKINLLVTITNAPAWAREVGFDQSVAGPAADPQNYAAFVATLASKFCGSRLQAIEIWHGQNLHYTWGNHAPDPLAYIQMLQAAYSAIKNACPTMLVISGAPIPAGSNLPIAMDDLDYMEAMYKAGLANYADAIGAHHDGYNIPPLATWQNACEATQQTGRQFDGACESPHHSWSLRSTLEGYREIMLRHDDAEKRIWPTAFGWPAGGATSPAYTPTYLYAADNDRQEQATWSVEAYRMMQEWGWVGPAFLSNLNLQVVNADQPEAMWSILQSDYAALPVFAALKALAKGPDVAVVVTACADPRSAIHTPTANQVLSGISPISGVATDDAFQFYKLEYAPEADAMGGFAYFGGGQTEVNDGVLGMFDTTLIPNGEYIIRLTVVNHVGNFLPPCDVPVTVQN